MNKEELFQLLDEELVETIKENRCTEKHKHFLINYVSKVKWRLAKDNRIKWKGAKDGK